MTVRVERLTRTYGGAQAVTALAGVDAEFHRGTFTAVMGPSGSGKSTLLQCAAGLDRPSSGRVWIGDQEISRMGETRRTELASHLVREEGKVVFSNNAPSVPLLPGAQDRLSVVMQLGALLAGDPARYPEGSRISIQTVGPREAGVWTFIVEGTERIEVPAGEYEVRRLSRAPRSEHDYKLELWLAPELGWLPARMRQTEQDGDVIDLSLRGVEAP